MRRGSRYDLKRTTEEGEREEREGKDGDVKVKVSSLVSLSPFSLPRSA